MQRVIVILGTGGTIAGTAAAAGDNIGSRAGARPVTQLLEALPLPSGVAVESEQVAQLDSKDMDHSTWQQLAQRIAHHLGRAEVDGVVVTHGTDTLEETAWFLHRVLAPAKPVVLTAAMRPATALSPDGPQNLADALAVAAEPGARGVVAAIAGRVHAPGDLRKLHPYRVDAFGSGDAGPIAVIEEGRLRRFRPWPDGMAMGVPKRPPGSWPWVEVVASHAGARPDAVRALVDSGVRGLVVAATGNGTVHAAIEPALAEARAAGVTVWTSTRCVGGSIVGADAAPGAALSPWAARIELMLGLMAQGAEG